jgi:hypothetical protein
VSNRSESRSISTDELIMTVEMMEIEIILQRAAKKPRFEPYRSAIRDPKPTKIAA